MKKVWYLIILTLVLGSCKKPYDLPAVASNVSYLVVEGFINTGQDSTIITLTRTVDLKDANTYNPEKNAKVNIEGNDGGTYPLKEIKPGIYTVPPLTLNESNLYRLDITTSDGKTYQSDFEKNIQSPPIDSITYKVVNNGVQVNVNSHDSKNETHYYRYEYQETWDIHAAYDAEEEVGINFVGTYFIRSRRTPQTYQCWITNPSSDIIVGSSAKLSQDVISDLPITFIRGVSEKLADVYSIQVRQYGLSAKAYTYWSQLKKDTEDLGGIFDAQPSEIPGNIHCTTDPSERVIGYISVGSTYKKRSFIYSYDLPVWDRSSINAGCKLDTFYYANPKTGVNDVAAFLYSKLEYPVNSVGFPKVIGHTGSSITCIDCTLRGSNVKPSFWPLQ
ncbi:MAG TPA: DUF4249 domain-containing protein [Mucilaginibacter sp.]|nr:DUF4249 domain-containing protein [Mucilaginibacter sp.]